MVLSVQNSFLDTDLSCSEIADNPCGLGKMREFWRWAHSSVNVLNPTRLYNKMVTMGKKRLKWYVLPELK